MRLISQNAEVSSRQLADQLNISNGAAYYVLAALIKAGFVKLGNFKENSHKGNYKYLLTSTGVREKYLLTQSFIERKREEFKLLRAEIKSLEEEFSFEGKLRTPGRDETNNLSREWLK